MAQSAPLQGGRAGRGGAGGLPELGGFAGWRDGIATDGSTWTPEMDVSEEEWETIKEGDRLRMQARPTPVPPHQRPRRQPGWLSDLRPARAQRRRPHAATATRAPLGCRCVSCVMRHANRRGRTVTPLLCAARIN